MDGGGGTGDENSINIASATRMSYGRPCSSLEAGWLNLVSYQKLIIKNPPAPLHNADTFFSIDFSED